MRTILIWIAATFVFGAFYTMIAQKETLRKSGQTVYLALAPVDPRSLLQGDYMALNYQIMTQFTEAQFKPPPPDSGLIVIQLDAQSVGKFVRYDKGGPLAPGEFRLKYHRAHYREVIGAESFFIPEGTGDLFAHAAYGELKVEPDGTPLIVALCDKDRQRITASADLSPH